MKICILVPAADQMNQAGVRIRYRRIENEIRDHNHVLEFMVMSDLSGQAQLVHDVYIISKCYDARAILVAAILKNAGKLVGVDLFDDYFSQSEDSRLTRFRHWLSVLQGSVDFMLCSTPVMYEVSQQLVPDKPTHLMNDPCEPVEAQQLQKTVIGKLEKLHRTDRVDIAWFGIGDNPYFSVGLEDVANYADRLADFNGHGYEVCLNIMTNQRAMTAEKMAMLRRLPLAYTVDEWTLEKESSLLARCLVCILPVNAQNFSIAKSLNRAVSALSAGVQVVSIGYPLYESLTPFIYNAVKDFMADLQKNQLKLRADTVPELVTLLEKNADPVAESAMLLEFLQELASGNSRGNLAASDQGRTFALIHGRESAIDVYKFARDFGALSVSCPYSKQAMEYDIRFDCLTDNDGVEISVSDRAIPALKSGTYVLTDDQREINGVIYRKLKLTGTGMSSSTGYAALCQVDIPTGYTAAQAVVLQHIGTVLQTIIPGVRSYYAESAKISMLGG